MNKTIPAALLLAAFIIVTGFNLDNAIVPKEQILSGGPPKDGIPAILEPRFVPAGKTDFLDDDDIVIGVAVNGEARAYPIKILNWHEVVNDTVSGVPIAATF